MNIKTIIKWGLMLGIAEVLGTQILTWLGLGTSIWFIVMLHVLIVGFVILSLRDLKKLSPTEFNFLNAVILVAVMILIAKLIFQFYMFIYINYVDPLWVETTCNTWTASMQEAKVNQEQIETTLDNFRNSYKTIPMFTSGVFLESIPFIIEGIIVTAFYVMISKRINMTNI